jgi:hypothetical protein
VDVLRLYVVWHPSFAHGEVFSHAIADHFDGLGMVRDNLRLSVPVRVRAAPWNGAAGTPPKEIDLGAAEANGIILLMERGLVHAIDRGEWRGYFQSLGAAIKQSSSRTFVFNVAFSRSAETVLQTLDASLFKDLQAHPFYVHTKGKTEPSGRAVRRLLLHIVNVTGYHFRATHEYQRKHRIFLSHARTDGGSIARAIHKYIRSIPFEVECFLDTHDLVTGNNYRQQFRDDIASSSFFVLHTDAYGSRPFCRWELLRAKEFRRPILSAFRLEKGEQRTFPYNGNIPFRPLFRHRSAGDLMPSDDSIQELLLDMMSEVLRCQIWERTARNVCEALGIRDAVLLPRPPELLDLAFLKAALRQQGRENEPVVVVYPDPPLDKSEGEVLDHLRGGVEFRALSELRR